jgi:hypothetical protein
MTSRTPSLIGCVFLFCIAFGCQQVRPPLQTPKPPPQSPKSNPKEVVILENILDRLNTPVQKKINPANLHAEVYITDVLRPLAFMTFGRGEMDRVRIVAYFSTYSAYSGRRDYVRFDPSVHVYCFVDGRPPVDLVFRDGRYTADIPRPSSSAGRNKYYGVLPNYYYFQVHAGEDIYVLARVPVVAPISHFDAGGDRFRPNDPIQVRFANESWNILWNPVDPHFRFRHENIGIVIEFYSSGGYRMVSQSRLPGTATTEPVTLEILPREPPLPSEESTGLVCVLTTFSSEDPATRGPSDFDLEWTSSAGAGTGITWGEPL